MIHQPTNLSLRPMLASAISTRSRLSTLPNASKWIVERKFDGYRVIAVRDDARIRLLSRNQIDLASRYPEIAHALESQPLHDFVVDGEVVALDGTATSFEKLQQRGKPITIGAVRKSGVQLAYYVFDLLRANHIDTRDLPLLRRKRLLVLALSFGRIIRYNNHRPAGGDLSQQFRAACRRGWEGLILKDGASRYEHRRSSSWLKLRCATRQEFVIGGFTDPQRGRTGFGALLVGYFDSKGWFRFAGRVGTGFSDALLRELTARLKSIEIGEPAFQLAADLPAAGAHWTRPEIVIEVSFTEWTRTGRLRHPVFLGFRPDREPDTVVREPV